MAEPTVQRRWQAACPNCGAPVEFASAASASAVCSFCRSTLVREGEALRKIGESAELFDDYSPLQLGSAGRHAGAPFTVVGRLQMVYAEGSWNEWHALFDNGKSGWLSEDNGSFVFAFDADLSEAPPQSHELMLGNALVLAGQSFRVAALTMAKVGAAQGELPRPPATGEFLVAELRSTQDEVGTLAYEIEGKPPQWSLGRAVRLADLALANLREAEGRTLGSQALPCPNCGAPLQPKLDSSKSIVCPQCSAVVDLSKGAGADLAHFAQAQGRPPQIPLGSVGALPFDKSGTPISWQVVGYQERCDIPESSDDETTFWHEYLLFNKSEGFVFLVDAEDGWSLVRPLTGTPRAGAVGDAEWQGKRFKRGYSYGAKSTYVLGEFYWQLTRGQVVQVTDFDGGDALLSREQTGTEISWSAGRKLDAAEVAAAFK
ncbi:MAG TPA: DUF4178 domain-containing protein, partial [Burkholderiaceae bacterium]